MEWNWTRQRWTHLSINIKQRCSATRWQLFSKFCNYRGPRPAADVDQNQTIHIADIIMSLHKSAPDQVPLEELSGHRLKTEFLQFNRLSVLLSWLTNFPGKLKKKKEKKNSPTHSYNLQLIYNALLHVSAIYCASIILSRAVLLVALMYEYLRLHVSCTSICQFDIKLDFLWSTSCSRHVTR